MAAEKVTLFRANRETVNSVPSDVPVPDWLNFASQL